MKNNNWIVCLVAHSGAGKTTLAEELEQKYGYKVLSSYTTREPRYKGEKGHIFITEEEYERMKQEEEIVAYTFFNGHHYFSTKRQLMENDIYVIDPDGVEYMKSITDMKTIVININIDEYTRLYRMLYRGDSMQTIRERIKNDHKKFANLEFDYSVLNLDKKKACKIIHRIIIAEIGGTKLLSKRIQDLFKTILNKIKL